MARLRLLVHVAHRRVCLTLAPVALCLITGCAAKIEEPVGTALSTADFHTDAATPSINTTVAIATPASAMEQSSAPAPKQTRLVAADSLQDASDVQVLPGDPPARAPRAVNEDDTPPDADAPDEQPVEVVVDALVGQINGRPVFASAFFAPMNARLRAEAARLPRRDWLRFAQEQINASLHNRIVDELLLAEFESSLNEQQKAGLLAFVGTLRRQLISEAVGSEEIANSRLQEKEGLSVEEKVRDLRNRELIRQEIIRSVRDKVIVTWRDVQQEYDRRVNDADFQPTVKLRMIWIDASDQERIERVETALESGEAFEDVASRESDYRRSQGGLREAKLDAPTYAESTLFGPKELNDRAAALEAGQRVGPFDFKGKAVWLYLESLSERNESLYDKQLEIYEQLWSQRFTQENRLYLERLIEHGSITDIRLMQRKLLLFAADRYLIVGVQ